VFVIGVEANPKLISVIEKTREINDGLFEILHRAYATSGNTITFHEASEMWGGSSYSNHPLVSEDGETHEITTASLSDILADYKIDGKVQLIADIEGQEIDLITDEYDTLSSHCELLIIELHDDLVRPDMETIREQLRTDFEHVDSIERTHVYYNKNV